MQGLDYLAKIFEDWNYKQETIECATLIYFC